MTQFDKNNPFANYQLQKQTQQATQPQSFSDIDRTSMSTPEYLQALDNLSAQKEQQAKQETAQEIARQKYIAEQRKKAFNSDNYYSHFDEISRLEATRYGTSGYDYAPDVFEKKKQERVREAEERIRAKMGSIEDQDNHIQIQALKESNVPQEQIEQTRQIQAHLKSLPGKDRLANMKTYFATNGEQGLPDPVMFNMWQKGDVNELKAVFGEEVANEYINEAIQRTKQINTWTSNSDDATWTMGNIAGDIASGLEETTDSLQLAVALAKNPQGEGHPVNNQQLLDYIKDINQDGLGNTLAKNWSNKNKESAEAKGNVLDQDAQDKYNAELIASHKLGQNLDVAQKNAKDVHTAETVDNVLNNTRLIAHEVPQVFADIATSVGSGFIAKQVTKKALGQTVKQVTKKVEKDLVKDKIKEKFVSKATKDLNQLKQEAPIKAFFQNAKDKFTGNLDRLTEYEKMRPIDRKKVRESILKEIPKEVIQEKVTKRLANKKADDLIGLATVAGDLAMNSTQELIDATSVVTLLDEVPESYIVNKSVEGQRIKSAHPTWTDTQVANQVKVNAVKQNAVSVALFSGMASAVSGSSLLTEKLLNKTGSSFTKDITRAGLSFVSGTVDEGISEGFNTKSAIDTGNQALNLNSKKQVIADKGVAAAALQGALSGGAGHLAVKAPGFVSKKGIEAVGSGLKTASTYLRDTAENKNLNKDLGEEKAKAFQEATAKFNPGRTPTKNEDGSLSDIDNIDSDNYVFNANDAKDTLTKAMAEPTVSSEVREQYKQVIDSLDASSKKWQKHSIEGTLEDLGKLKESFTNVAENSSDQEKETLAKLNKGIDNYAKSIQKDYVKNKLLSVLAASEEQLADPKDPSKLKLNSESNLYFALQSLYKDEIQQATKEAQSKGKTLVNNEHIVNILADKILSGNLTDGLSNLKSELENKGAITNRALNVFKQKYNLTAEDIFKLGNKLNPTEKNDLGVLIIQRSILNEDQGKQLKSLLRNSGINPKLQQDIVSEIGSSSKSFETLETAINDLNNNQIFKTASMIRDASTLNRKEAKQASTVAKEQADIVNADLNTSEVNDEQQVKTASHTVNPKSVKFAQSIQKGIQNIQNSGLSEEAKQQAYKEYFDRIYKQSINSIKTIDVEGIDTSASNTVDADKATQKLDNAWNQVSDLLDVITREYKLVNGKLGLSKDFDNSLIHKALQQIKNFNQDIKQDTRTINGQKIKNNFKWSNAEKLALLQQWLGDSSGKKRGLLEYIIDINTGDTETKTKQSLRLAQFLQSQQAKLDALNILDEQIKNNPNEFLDTSTDAKKKKGQFKKPLTLANPSLRSKDTNTKSQSGEKVTFESWRALRGYRNKVLYGMQQFTNIAKESLNEDNFKNTDLSDDTISTQPVATPTQAEDTTKATVQKSNETSKPVKSETKPQVSKPVELTKVTNDTQAPVEPEVKDTQTKEINIASKVKNGYEILSNFAKTPFTYLGYTFGSAELAFQYAKVNMAYTLPDKEQVLEHIRKIKNPAQARAFGRKVKLDPALLKQWNQSRVQVMKDILTAKFSQNQEAQNILLQTGDATLTHNIPNFKPDFWTNAFPQVLTEVRQDLQSKTNEDTQEDEGIIEEEYIPEDITKTEVEDTPPFTDTINQSKEVANKAKQEPKEEIKPSEQTKNLKQYKSMVKGLVDILTPNMFQNVMFATNDLRQNRPEINVVFGNELLNIFNSLLGTELFKKGERNRYSLPQKALLPLMEQIKNKGIDTVLDEFVNLLQQLPKDSLQAFMGSYNQMLRANPINKGLKTVNAQSILNKDSKGYKENVLSLLTSSLLTVYYRQSLTPEQLNNPKTGKLNGEILNPFLNKAIRSLQDLAYEKDMYESTTESIVDNFEDYTAPFILDKFDSPEAQQLLKTEGRRVGLNVQVKDGNLVIKSVFKPDTTETVIDEKTGEETTKVIKGNMHESFNNAQRELLDSDELTSTEELKEVFDLDDKDLNKENQIGKGAPISNHVFSNLKVLRERIKLYLTDKTNAYFVNADAKALASYNRLNGMLNFYNINPETQSIAVADSLVNALTMSLGSFMSNVQHSQKTVKEQEEHFADQGYKPFVIDTSSKKNLTTVKGVQEQLNDLINNPSVDKPTTPINQIGLEKEELIQTLGDAALKYLNYKPKSKDTTLANGLRDALGLEALRLLETHGVLEQHALALIPTDIAIENDQITDTSQVPVTFYFKVKKPTKERLKLYDEANRPYRVTQYKSPENDSERFIQELTHIEDGKYSALSNKLFGKNRNNRSGILAKPVDVSNPNNIKYTQNNKLGIANQANQEQINLITAQNNTKYIANLDSGLSHVGYLAGRYLSLTNSVEDLLKYIDKAHNGTLNLSKHTPERQSEIIKELFQVEQFLTMSGVAKIDSTMLESTQQRIQSKNQSIVDPLIEFYQGMEGVRVSEDHEQIDESTPVVYFANKVVDTSRNMQIGIANPQASKVTRVLVRPAVTTADGKLDEFGFSLTNKDGLIQKTIADTKDIDKENVSFITDIAKIAKQSLINSFGIDTKGNKETNADKLLANFAFVLAQHLGVKVEKTAPIAILNQLDDLLNSPKEGTGKAIADAISLIKYTSGLTPSLDNDLSIYEIGNNFANEFGSNSPLAMEVLYNLVAMDYPNHKATEAYYDSKGRFQPISLAELDGASNGTNNVNNQTASAITPVYLRVLNQTSHVTPALMAKLGIKLDSDNALQDHLNSLTSMEDKVNFIDSAATVLANEANPELKDSYENVGQNLTNNLNKELNYVLSILPTYLKNNFSHLYNKDKVVSRDLVLDEDVQKTLRDSSVKKLNNSLSVLLSPTFKTGMLGDEDTKVLSYNIETVLQDLATALQRNPYLLETFTKQAQNLLIKALGLSFKKNNISSSGIHKVNANNFYNLYHPLAKAIQDQVRFNNGLKNIINIGLISKGNKINLYAPLYEKSNKTTTQLSTIERSVAKLMVVPAGYGAQETGIANQVVSEIRNKIYDLLEDLNQKFIKEGDTDANVRQWTVLNAYLDTLGVQKLRHSASDLSAHNQLKLRAKVLESRSGLTYQIKSSLAPDMADSVTQELGIQFGLNTAVTSLAQSTYSSFVQTFIDDVVKAIKHRNESNGWVSIVTNQDGKEVTQIEDPRAADFLSTKELQTLLQNNPHLPVVSTAVTASDNLLDSLINNGAILLDKAGKSESTFGTHRTIKSLFANSSFNSDLKEQAFEATLREIFNLYDVKGAGAQTVTTVPTESKAMNQTMVDAHNAGIPSSETFDGGHTLVAYIKAINKMLNNNEAKTHLEQNNILSMYNALNRMYPNAVANLNNANTFIELEGQYNKIESLAVNAKGIQLLELVLANAELNLALGFEKNMYSPQEYRMGLKNLSAFRFAIADLNKQLNTKSVQKLADILSFTENTSNENQDDIVYLTDKNLLKGLSNFISRSKFPHGLITMSKENLANTYAYRTLANLREYAIKVEARKKVEQNYIPKISQQFAFPTQGVWNIPEKAKQLYARYNNWLAKQEKNSSDELFVKFLDQDIEYQKALKQAITSVSGTVKQIAIKEPSATLNISFNSNVFNFREQMVKQIKGEGLSVSSLITQLKGLIDHDPDHVTRSFHIKTLDALLKSMNNLLPNMKIQYTGDDSIDTLETDLTNNVIKFPSSFIDYLTQYPNTVSLDEFIGEMVHEIQHIATATLINTHFAQKAGITADKAYQAGAVVHKNKPGVEARITLDYMENVIKDYASRYIKDPEVQEAMQAIRDAIAKDGYYDVNSIFANSNFNMRTKVLATALEVLNTKDESKIPDLWFAKSQAMSEILSYALTDAEMVTELSNKGMSQEKADKLKSQGIIQKDKDGNVIKTVTMNSILQSLKDKGIIKTLNSIKLSVRKLLGLPLAKDAVEKSYLGELLSAYQVLGHLNQTVKIKGKLYDAQKNEAFRNSPKVKGTLNSVKYAKENATDFLGLVSDSADVITHNSTLSDKHKTYLSNLMDEAYVNLAEKFDSNLEQLVKEYPAQYQALMDNSLGQQVDNSIQALRTAGIPMTAAEENAFKVMYGLSSVSMSNNIGLLELATEFNDILLDKSDNLSGLNYIDFAKLVPQLGNEGLIALALTNETVKDFLVDQLDNIKDETKKLTLKEKLSNVYYNKTLFNNKTGLFKSKSPEEKLENLGKVITAVNMDNILQATNKSALRIQSEVDVQKRENKISEALGTTKPSDTGITDALNPANLAKDLGTSKASVIKKAHVIATALANSGIDSFNGNGEDSFPGYVLQEISDTITRSYFNNRPNVVSKLLRIFRNSYSKTNSIYDMQARKAVSSEQVREYEGGRIKKEILAKFKLAELTPEMDKTISDTVIKPKLNDLYGYVLTSGKSQEQALNDLKTILANSQNLDNAEQLLIQEIAQYINTNSNGNTTTQLDAMKYIQFQTSGLADLRLNNVTKGADSFILPNARAIAKLSQFRKLSHEIQKYDASNFTVNNTDSKFSNLIGSLTTIKALQNSSEKELNNLKELLNSKPEGMLEILESMQAFDAVAKQVDPDSALGFDNYIHNKQDPNHDYTVLNPKDENYRDDVARLTTLGYRKTATLDNTYEVYATKQQFMQNITAGITGNIEDSVFGANPYNNKPLRFNGLVLTDNQVRKDITSNSIKQLKDIINSTDLYGSLPDTYSNKQALIDRSGNVVGTLVDVSTTVKNDLIDSTENGYESVANHFSRLTERYQTHLDNARYIGKLQEMYDNSSIQDKKRYILVNGSNKPFDNTNEGARRAQALNDWYWGLPRETRMLIPNGIHLDASELDNITGYEQASITDIFTGKSGLPDWVQNTVKAVVPMFFKVLPNKLFGFDYDNPVGNLARMERLASEVTSLSKDYILNRSLIVPLSNLVSNIIHLGTLGIPIKQIPKLMYEGYTFTKKYNDIKAEILALNYQNKKVTTTEAQRTKNIARINNLKTYLNKSPLSPLMEAGLYTSIEDTGLNGEVEDKPFDILTRASNKFNITSTKAKLPEIVRSALIMQNSKSHQFMNELMNYGDFVAKYALYRHYTTKKAYTSTHAINLVRNEFVNYSMNKGREFDYANKIGLTWFLAYKIGIQKIIYRMLRRNTLRTLATIGGAEAYKMGGLPFSKQLQVVPEQTLLSGMGYQFNSGNMLNGFSNHWLAQLMSMISK